MPFQVRVPVSEELLASVAMYWLIRPVLVSKVKVSLSPEPAAPRFTTMGSQPERKSLYCVPLTRDALPAWTEPTRPSPSGL